MAVEHWHDDQEVLGSIPTGGQFFISSLLMLAGFCQNLAEIEELWKNPITNALISISLFGSLS